MRPGVTQTESAGGFLGGDFRWRFNYRAQRVAHDTRIFPVGEVNPPLLVARFWLRYFDHFHAISEPVFFGRPVRESHRMKTKFWHSGLCGHGQDAIQFEEREGIL